MSAVQDINSTCLCQLLPVFSNTKHPLLLSIAIMAPPNNWLNRQVQGAVASAGGFVGNVINGVGNGVSGFGRGIGDRCAPFSPPRTNKLMSGTDSPSF